MQVNKITAPAGARLLSEILELNNEIPVNCLFDKGITGCGGTELAIRNGKNTIITVPYVSLVDNKVAQHQGELLGVHGGVPQGDIEEYITSHPRKKIIVTYNSLPRIINTLEQLGFNAYVDFFLLVDE